jgi:hypothetical protein
MPARSKKQTRLIWALRRKYGTKTKAPKKWKWVFDPEWTDVKYRDLPQQVGESRILFFESWCQQKEVR